MNNVKVRISHKQGTNKIPAIKMRRSVTHEDLKQAKTAIEEFVTFSNGMTEAMSYDIVMTENFAAVTMNKLGSFAEHGITYEIIEIKDAKDAKKPKKAKKVKSKGNQSFNVPNTEGGREFIKSLRLFRNGKFTIRLRGRGTRKTHGNSQDLKPEHAEWIAVYVDAFTPALDNQIRIAEQKIAEAKKYWIEEGRKAAIREATPTKPKDTSLLTVEAIKEIRNEGIVEGRRQLMAEGLHSNRIEQAKREVLGTLDRLLITQKS